MKKETKRITKLNETKNWFFHKIKKIDKSLIRIINKIKKSKIKYVS